MIFFKFSYSLFSEENQKFYLNKSYY